MDLAIAKHNTDTSDLNEAADTFQTLIIGMRRVARRVARRNLPELPGSERELLNLVAENRGIGVNEAARRMLVSPNTVSTLVRTLCRKGLIERLSDPSDRRVALLHPTAAGMARKQKATRLRVETMVDAMLALDQKNRRLVLGAIPAMQRLLAELERIDNAQQAEEGTTGGGRNAARS
jgi:DNA-binding MarR family transcriptional regulator